ncbi:MAG: DUF488 family protein [Acidimicrobiales bacterium]|nr:DUF488 family protein [Acidimicrobiales bacterium]
MSSHDRSSFEVRRVYDPHRGDDAYRVLVDRLWPRGLAKAEAGIDEWAKDVAPSPELRRWYGHDPAKFDEFARRYREELARPPASDAIARLQADTREHRVALLTATRDVEHSGAAVLNDFLAHPPRRRETSQD